MLVFIAAGYTKASRALGWTLGLTFLLLLPLGASFLRLVRQSRLEATIKGTLVKRTVTIGQPNVELISTKINWTTKPPTIYLNVQTQKKITPKQVRLVQEFISREMNQSYRLIFFVSEIHQVTGEDRGEANIPALPLLNSSPPPTLPYKPKK
jgi:hypothetical protein